MALVKVFSALGVKTVEMMGNVSEQDFDESDPAQVLFSELPGVDYSEDED